MRLPQPFFRIMLREFGAVATPEQAEALAREMMGVAGTSSRTANEMLLKRLGLDLSHDLDEAYYGEALHYHLGLMFGHMGHPERMAEHIGRSHAMPSPEDDQVFSERLNSSRVVRAWQKRAIARGMPPILVACMPRSGSGTLTQTLSALFDMPSLHLSVGWFPNYYLVPSWLGMFLEGGAITQDHFGPGDFNAGVIASRRISDMFVLVRDPRAAACSWAHFTAAPHRAAGQADLPFDRRVEEIFAKRFVPWLQGWCERAKDPGFHTRVHWLTFREVTTDQPGVLRRICDIMGNEYPALRSLREAPVTEMRSHFVHGNDEAWRDDVAEPTQRCMWEQCPPEMRDLLDLKP
jgi:hypothetical protein